MNTVDTDLIEQARIFAATEIRPFARSFDEQQQGIPRSLIHKMGKMGFLGATISQDYGGSGLDAVSYGQMTEEIGKACASTRSLLTVHTSLAAEAIARSGSRDQRLKWLPAMVEGSVICAFALTEPEVGSDAGAIQASYTRAGDRYILNGRKKWISFGGIADLLIVIAKRDGQTSAFLVERSSPGVKTSPMSGLLGNRAAYISEIELANVEVPEEALLGGEGNGFSFVVNTALDHGRYSIAWAGVALAQEALDCMIGYAAEREQFGRKIIQFQFIQGFIADAQVNIHAARAQCMEVGRARQKKRPEAVTETIMAKYFSSKLAMRVATDAVQVHGGNGCYNKYPVERLFREAKVLEIIEGTSQLQQELIAMSLLSEYKRSRK